MYVIYICIIEPNSINEDYATSRVVGVRNNDMFILARAWLQVVANRHYSLPNRIVDELSPRLSRWTSLRAKGLTVLFPTPVGPMTLSKTVSGRFDSSAWTGGDAQNNEISFSRITHWPNGSVILSHPFRKLVGMSIAGTTRKWDKWMLIYHSRIQSGNINKGLIGKNKLSKTRGFTHGMSISMQIRWIRRNNFTSSLRHVSRAPPSSSPRFSVVDVLLPLVWLCYLGLILSFSEKVVTYTAGETIPGSWLSPLAWTFPLCPSSTFLSRSLLLSSLWSSWWAASMRNSPEHSRLHWPCTLSACI